MPLPDTYATHIFALTAAVIRSTGPIIEFGCGHYSTPLLHELCRADRRVLLSTDSDKAWLERFIDLATDWHQFQHVPDWAAFELARSPRWGVAFIDHAPGERRVKDIERLKEICTFIVIHDTETDFNVGTNYGYEPLISSFKFRTDHKRYRPYTTVVSQFAQLELDPRKWKPSDVE